MQSDNIAATVHLPVARLALFGSAVAVLVALPGCDAHKASAATSAASASASEAGKSPAQVIGSADTSASATAAAASQPMVTLSAVGDCTIGDPVGAERAGGSFHDVFAKHGSDMARPFSGVVAKLSEDDLTIANLETTLGTRAGRTDLPFSFRGNPAFAQMLPAGSVELVNIANNHSHDCGMKGVDDTIAALDAAHVDHFGLGHADIRTIHGIEVVNLGYTGGRVEIKDGVVRDVKEHKRADNLVIVTFHWGIEGEHATNTVQMQLGRAAVDAGADLVLGHHPHVLQGIESYHGKKIVYSLGNFVFGGNAKPAELDSMIYRARFTRKDGKVEPLDDEIFPVSISGDRAQNDFRPVLLAGGDADRIRHDVDAYTHTILLHY